MSWDWIQGDVESLESVLFPDATDHQIPEFSVPAATFRARDASEVDARAQFGFGRQTDEADEPDVWREAVTFADGRPIRLVTGEYPVVAPLIGNVADPTDLTVVPRIIGDGPDGTRLIHKAPAERLIRCVGSFDYLGVTNASEWLGGQQLTAATAIGTRVYTVPSTASLAVYDYVKIRDESQPMISDWDGTTIGVAGQTVHIRSIDSATQFTAFGEALFTYSTTARVVKYVSPGVPILRDFSIRPDDPLDLTSAASIGIELQHCMDLDIANIGYSEMPNAMISLAHCIGGSIRSIRSENGRNNLSTGPYVVKFSIGCQGIALIDGQSRYGRHLTTSTGSAHEIPPSHIQVAMCRVFEHSASAYDQHPSARWWLFSSCMAIMGNKDDQRSAADQAAVNGFQPRGWDTSIVNPYVVGHDVGIGCSAGAKRIRVEGGLLEKCRVGVYSQTLDGLRMRGTLIKDSRERGLFLTPTCKTPGGVAQVKNIDIDSSVTIEGNQSIAPIELQAWDDSNRVQPRLIGNTLPPAGLRTRQLASAATLTVPITADYYEVTGTTTITRFAANADQQGRSFTLMFNSALTLNAPNVIVTSTTIPALTQVTFSTDGTMFTEISRIVKPALLVLDAAGTALAWRAYGLRKMRFNYTGSAIRVRRSSDSTEQDIGFDSLGALDTTALLAFTGGGSGFVKTLYDQSTSGLNMSQATTTRQPRIVNAGVVDVVNTHPAMVFDGVDDYFASTSGLFAAESASAFVICAGSGASILGLISESHAGADTAVYGLLGVSSTSKLTSSVINDAIASQLAASGVDGTFFDGTLRVASVVDSALYTDNGVDPDLIYDSNSQVFRNNGVSDATRTYTRTGTYANINTLGIGARPVPSLYYPGSISEVILFRQAVTAADRAALEANQIAWAA